MRSPVLRPRGPRSSRLTFVWQNSPCFAFVWQEPPRQRQSGGKKPHQRQSHGTRPTPTSIPRNACHANVNQGAKNHTNVNPMERAPRQRQSHGTPATPTSIPWNVPQSQTHGLLCGPTVCHVMEYNRPMLAHVRLPTHGFCGGAFSGAELFVRSTALEPSPRGRKFTPRSCLFLPGYRLSFWPCCPATYDLRPPPTWPLR